METPTKYPNFVYNSAGRCYYHYKEIGYVGQSETDKRRIKEIRKRWAKPTFLLRSFKGIVIVYHKYPV